MNKKDKLELDFYEHEGFKEIKRKMGIDLKKRISLEKHDNVNKLANELQKIWKEISSKKGKNLKDLSKIIVSEDGTIEYEGIEGKKIIVYIKNYDEWKIKKWGNPKFHIAFCEKLQEMKNNNKLENYIAIEKDKPIFEFNIRQENNEIIEKELELKVCKYCLEKLNYKNYKSSDKNTKNMIYENFLLDKFLEEYSEIDIEIPKLQKKYHSKKSNFYTNNWKEISKLYRESVNWKCEECGKDCTTDKAELHVHHIDMMKSNNLIINLKALCKDCHANQPFHEHLKKSRI